jgi:hypothetical protein
MADDSSSASASNARDELSKTRTLAVVSLVLTALVPLAVALVFVLQDRRAAVVLFAASFLLAIAAIVLAVIALKRTRKGRVPGARGMAITAVVLSLLMIVLLVIVTVLIALVVSALRGMT